MMEINKLYYASHRAGIIATSIGNTAIAVYVTGERGGLTEIWNPSIPILLRYIKNQDSSLIAIGKTVISILL